MGRTPLGGDGGIDSGSGPPTHDRTALLSGQFTVGRGALCPGGASPLGCGEQSALGHRRLFPRGSEPRPGRPRRRESGHAASACLEFAPARKNQKTGPQRQTTQCGPGSRLFAPITGNLDAFALPYCCPPFCLPHKRLLVALGWFGNSQAQACFYGYHSAVRAVFRDPTQQPARFFESNLHD